MKREIKFRAWDKGRKKMSNAKEFSLWCDYWENIEYIWTNNDLPQWKNLIFLQYTGLKDKNGKEIYEGDIMNVQMDFGPGGYAFRVVSIPPLVPPTDWVNYGLWHLGEIIGNIYENPELLKDQEE